MSVGAGAAPGRTVLRFPADHPVFAGHFPGFPLLPGALLLDAALHEIARSRELDLTQWRLAAAKFLQIVPPGARLLLDHAVQGDGRIRFTVHGADRTVASGMLSHGA
jgi:3-hydroxymyristoyl/3-hydroxydecanoyl-(acyl carrier protein) dehydratase